MFIGGWVFAAARRVAAQPAMNPHRGQDPTVTVVDKPKAAVSHPPEQFDPQLPYSEPPVVVEAGERSLGARGGLCWMEPVGPRWSARWLVVVPNMVSLKSDQT